MIRIISSGSQGNAYILEGYGEILLIECGVSLKDISKTLNYDLSKVVGVCVSHSHG